MQFFVIREGDFLFSATCEKTRGSKKKREEEKEIYMQRVKLTTKFPLSFDVDSSRPYARESDQCSACVPTVKSIFSRDLQKKITRTIARLERARRNRCSCVNWRGVADRARENEIIDRSTVLRDVVTVTAACHRRSVSSARALFTASRLDVARFAFTRERCRRTGRARRKWTAFNIKGN